MSDALHSRSTLNRARSPAGAAILTPVVTSGCVDPSDWTALSLTRYGLDQGQPQCVGKRREASRSIDQLQQLGPAARVYREGDAAPGRLMVADLIRVSSPIEVGRAAAGCGVPTGEGPSL